MDRAEEKALEVYPIVELTAYNEEGKIVTIDANEESRRLFMEGYRKARKDLREEVAACKAKNWNDGFNDGYKKAKQDLALTWTDIEMIRIIMDKLYSESFHPIWDAEEFYSEVLKRFNDLRK